MLNSYTNTHAYVLLTYHTMLDDSISNESLRSVRKFVWTYMTSLPWNTNHWC